MAYICVRNQEYCIRDRWFLPVVLDRKYFHHSTKFVFCATEQYCVWKISNVSVLGAELHRVKKYLTIDT